MNHAQSTFEKIMTERITFNSGEHLIKICQSKYSYDEIWNSKGNRAFVLPKTSIFLKPMFVDAEW